MSYKTVRAEAVGSIIVEKSEFIAKIAPVRTSEEALNFISSVRAEHRRARHNCYAYILREGGETRFSDDGEPQGTAGPPILDVLQKNGLQDVGIVVTRYFGGILLGKGGLTRAYSSAASAAVSAAEIMDMKSARDCLIKFDYSFYDRVLRLLPDFGIKTLDAGFSENVTMKLLVEESSCEGFAEALREEFNAKISPEFSETYFADFS